MVATAGCAAPAVPKDGNVQEQKPTQHIHPSVAGIQWGIVKTRA